MITLKEYCMNGDGFQAPGAIVLRQNMNNPYHPFVVHFRNDQCGGYHGGVYCSDLGGAEEAFHDKIKRYDPTGRLSSLKNPELVN